MGGGESCRSHWMFSSLPQGALSERPQMFLDQLRQTDVCCVCHFSVRFQLEADSSQSVSPPPYSPPLLSTWVLFQPTVEKVTAKTKEARRMKRKGGWLTGWNWPVFCVGGSFPAKRPWLGTSSSLNYIRCVFCHATTKTIIVQLQAWPWSEFN